MRRIFKYTFSLFMFAWLTAGAQTNGLDIGGLRFGFDISRIAVPFLEDGRVEYDGSIDLRINKDLYPVIEVGWGNFETEKINFKYRSTGYSLRAGIDKNYLKKDNADEMGMFFVGVRYGLSFFKHESPFLKISDPYWGDYYGAIPIKNLHAHWLEFTTGIRVEIIKNIYLGWSLRGRLLLNKYDDTNMSPYYIPGYGKVSGNTNMGFRYSIFYQLPLKG